MTKKLSRREMLSAGSIAGLTLIGAGVSGYAVGKEPASTEFPWTYKKLRTKKTSTRGYKDYFQAGCMYGVFEAIVGQMGDKWGEPYSSFPMGMISYGGGGIALWGSTCGTLNGAAAAIALFVTHGTRRPLCPSTNPRKRSRARNRSRNRKPVQFCATRRFRIGVKSQGTVGSARRGQRGADALSLTSPRRRLNC